MVCNVDVDVDDCLLLLVLLNCVDVEVDVVDALIAAANVVIDAGKICSTFMFASEAGATD